MNSKGKDGIEGEVAVAYDQAAQALLTAAGQGDSQLVGHSERVARYSTRVGLRLSLSPKELTDLRYAASLHDIGKIGVSRDIVNKLGKLTDEEFGAMRLHSLIGIRILEKIEGLKGALPLIKHHHERWDGQGYPDKLAGDAIPLGARIIAIAESFDILTSELPWRRPMSAEDAVVELRRCAGTQFDPHMVSLFVEEVMQDWELPLQAQPAPT